LGRGRDGVGGRERETEKYREGESNRKREKDT
jgi:hypothetical protein